MNIFFILIINSFLSAIGSALGMTMFETYIKPNLHKLKLKRGIQNGNNEHP